MASPVSTRIYRTLKAAGRPWPVFDDDDVIDYQILEAVVAKINKEDSDREKQQQRARWKKAPDPALEALR